MGLVNFLNPNQRLTIIMSQNLITIRVLEDGETWSAGSVDTAFLTQEQFKFLCEDTSLQYVVEEFGIPMSNLELKFANLIAEIFSNPDNDELRSSLNIDSSEIDQLYERAIFLLMSNDKEL